MNRMHGTKDFWLGALRSDGPAFRAAVSAVDGDAPVPTCPGWTIAELVVHLGGVYAWIGSHVARGVTDRPDGRPGEGIGDVPGWPATITWWDEQYARLMKLLDALDSDLPAWNWAPQPKKAVFWDRRVAHETAVHRWDAQFAIGAAEPLEAKLAADGISEVLDTWLPAGRRKGHSDLEGVVHLAATDVAQDWYVRLRGEGVALLDTGTLLDDDDHHTRVEAVGTASDLLLAMYGRVQFDVVDVAGEIGLLGGLRTG
jgi:uncharacterized protein (TIGR03083 family)